MRATVREVPVPEAAQQHAVRLVMATQPDSEYAPELVKQSVALGSSPRGAQALILAAKVNALHDSAVRFRSSPRALAAGLGITLLHKAVAVCRMYLAARALGIDIHIGYFFVFGPIRECILMVPISINGIGLREASAVFLYTKAGMAEPQALAFSLLVYAVRLTMSAIGGVVYAVSRSPQKGEA